MKEHPILFKGEMVRAILNCKPGVWPAEPIDPALPFKCQTRRLLTLRNSLIDGVGHSGAKWKAWWEKLDFSKAWLDAGPSPAGNPGPYLHVPYPPEETVHRIYPRVQPGNGLWVREAWAVSADYRGVAPRNVPASTPVYYRADGDITPQERTYLMPGEWRPSIHMPRWASRLNLAVKAVRVERVQAISNGDAKAEGVTAWHSEHPQIEKHNRPSGSYRNGFHALWDSINAPRGYSWESNPWVWVVEFMREVS